MKDYFYEKINYLLNKLNIKIDYEIKKTDDEYNFLFVQKKYDKYYFNVNDKKIDIDLIDIFLLHEIFHIIQFEEKFPMLILSDNTMKYSIIQKIITDLYNTEKMIEANYLNEAFTLHQYRLNNLKLKNLKMNKIDLIQFEDAYRIAYIIAENDIFFKNKDKKENIEFDDLKKEFFNKKTKEIYEIIIDYYNKKDINGMYLNLLKTINPQININYLDKNIIIV